MAQADPVVHFRYYRKGLLVSSGGLSSIRVARWGRRHTLRASVISRLFTCVSGTEAHE